MDFGLVELDSITNKDGEPLEETLELSRAKISPEAKPRKFRASKPAATAVNNRPIRHCSTVGSTRQPFLVLSCQEN